MVGTLGGRGRPVRPASRRHGGSGTPSRWRSGSVAGDRARRGGRGPAQRGRSWPRRHAGGAWRRVPVLLAMVAHLPPGRRAMERPLGRSGSAAAAGGVLRLLRFDVGPVGAGWLVWGIPLGAGFVLFVARDVRLDWATRWWVAAVATVAVAYAGAVGWLGAGGGATLVLLAPAAAVLRGGRARRGGFRGRPRENSLRMASESQRRSRPVPGCRVVPDAGLSVDGRSSLPSVGYGSPLSGARRPRRPRVMTCSGWVIQPACRRPPGRYGLELCVRARRACCRTAGAFGLAPTQASVPRFYLTRAQAGLTVRLGAGTGTEPQIFLRDRARWPAGHNHVKDAGSCQFSAEPDREPGLGASQVRLDRGTDAWVGARPKAPAVRQQARADRDASPGRICQAGGGTLAGSPSQSTS